MTTAEMAALHARAFTTPRPWSVLEFEALLASLHVFAEARPGGFALGRVVADEAELLTIAVEPALRRQGIGAALVAAVEATSRLRRARRIYLEVAEDNAGALALYRRSGFVETGRRRGYYRPADALILAKELPPRPPQGLGA
jgi:ribosomal-protein-alanine N-acetyltransferase